MARYFHRKITRFGLPISEIKDILRKEEKTLTQTDQKNLWQFWDLFKKTITFTGATLRIKTGESLFSLSNTDLIERFETVFSSTEVINGARYTTILRQIDTIHDWYIYLKSGGIHEIQKIYKEVFPKIMSAIPDNL